MFFKQQGDCLIKSAEIPENAVPMESTTLVESTVTGNKHMITGAAKLFKAADVIYIRSPEAFEVVHTDTKEGHAPLQIPAGQYFFGQPLEYDHFLEEARAVQD